MHRQMFRMTIPSAEIIVTVHFNYITKLSTLLISVTHLFMAAHEFDAWHYSNYVHSLTTHIHTSIRCSVDMAILHIKHPHARTLQIKRASRFDVIDFQKQFGSDDPKLFSCLKSQKQSKAKQHHLLSSEFRLQMAKF